MHLSRTLRQAAVLSVLGTTLTAVSYAQGKQQSDAQTQADVQSGLKGRNYAGIQVSVQNGTITLTGTVPSLMDKIDAERRAMRRSTGHPISDKIQVETAQVPDETLHDKIAKKLTYVREGYNTEAFDAFAADVKDGVVTLAGFAVSNVDKDEAIDDVASVPGVRGLVDKVEVAPTSPNDDRLRMALRQAIYGSAMLSSYVVDPTKPIRILVENGKVTLVGTVETQAQKDTAGIKANGVPGVFKVTNALTVSKGNER